MSDYEEERIFLQEKIKEAVKELQNRKKQLEASELPISSINFEPYSELLDQKALGSNIVELRNPKMIESEPEKKISDSKTFKLNEDNFDNDTTSWKPTFQGSQSVSSTTDKNKDGWTPLGQPLQVNRDEKK